MAKIQRVIAHEILDSRGIPTVEAIVELADSSVGAYSVPAGLSVGKHEAVELRDEDPRRYNGKGVLKSLEIIYNVLSPIVIGKDSQDQKKIDQEMIAADGTKNKSNLGANSILALSGAIVKAEAESKHIPLYQYIAQLSGIDTHYFSIPTPMFNILNGGAHGGGNLDFQEFMIVPQKAHYYSTALRIGTEIYYNLKQTIISHNGIFLVGDEGGYAPTLYSNFDGFKILEEAISKAGYKLGLDVFFSLDVAASHFKKGGSYKIKDRPVALSSGDFIDYYINLNEQYHLISLEDPLGEDDWGDWTNLCNKLGQETIIVGDDLTSTNLERLEKAVTQKSANGIIIKPNQVGTITETLAVIAAAKKANYKIFVSHRSGETNETFIADFAVGVGADYAKFGAPARGERVAKYNRLLEIEHELS